MNVVHCFILYLIKSLLEDKYSYAVNKSARVVFPVEKGHAGRYLKAQLDLLNK